MTQNCFFEMTHSDIPLEMKLTAELVSSATHCGVDKARYPNKASEITGYSGNTLISPKKDSGLQDASGDITDIGVLDYPAYISC